MIASANVPTLALTHSSWLNAWTLRQACAAVQVDLRVSPSQPRELPLPLMPPLNVPDWQFFTDEASLARALASGGPGRFLPQHFPAELLDDKWAFAAYLARDTGGPRGLRQWPLSQADTAPWPLLLKCRHSWADGQKLPRGWVCRNADELAAKRAQLPALGLREEWFFLQEWLGESPLRLFSVGGFFDAANEARNLAVVTDRVADYGPGPSSSAMLVTVPDEHGMVAQASRLLRRLAYCGPYELEFIVTGGRCLVLELNPRFWMQHGLFLAAGNGLVKRYLGLDTPADHACAPPEKLLWADGVWLARRLLRLDRHVLALWRYWVGGQGYRAVVCPPLRYVLAASLWRLLRGGR